MSPMKSPVEMKNVASSNIHSIGYNPEAKELHVRFKGSGETYVYSGVTPEKHQAVLSGEDRAVIREIYRDSNDRTEQLLINLTRVRLA